MLLSADIFGFPSSQPISKVLIWFAGSIACFLVSTFCINYWVVARRFRSIVNDFDAAMPEQQHLRMAGDLFDCVQTLATRAALILQTAHVRELSIADYSKDLVCAVRNDGEIAAINFAAKQTLGYVPIALVGKRLSDFMVDQQSWDLFKQAPREPLDVQMRSASNKPIDIRWQVEYSTKQKLYFCIGEDITEEKSIERLKQEFFQMVSHDLKTPLASLQLTLALIERGVYGQLAEQGQIAVRESDESLQRLLKLIYQLLELEQAAQGELPIVKANTDTASLIGAAVTIMQPIAAQKDIRIVAVPESVQVSVDPDRIIQVLVNLLANAVKFSSRESTVEIKFRSEQGFVEISIADEGPGVPEDQRSAIFERFRQARLADRHSGSGLGLAICKSIIDAHHGKIGVREHEPTGSEFYIQIPAGNCKAAAE